MILKLLNDKSVFLEGGNYVRYTKPIAENTDVTIANLQLYIIIIVGETLIRFTDNDDNVKLIQ